MPMANIIAEFLEITKPAFIIVKSRHSVKHQIKMFGQPVFKQSRHLHPNKLKAAKTEFQFLLDQGFCRPSKNQ